MLSRRTVALCVVALCLSPVVAWAQAPDYAFRYSATEKKTVWITSIDPKGLGAQMGLKAGDTIYLVNDAKIESARDVEKTFGALREGYTIVVLRPGKEKGSEPEKITLEGRIKKSDKEGKFYKTDK